MCCRDSKASGDAGNLRDQIQQYIDLFGINSNDVKNLTISALVVDFRLRIALALATALCLGAASRSGLLERWPDNAALGWLGKVSFSVFLVHFPVCLLANAAYVKSGLSLPSTAAAGASNAIAAIAAAV